MEKKPKFAPWQQEYSARYAAPSTCHSPALIFVPRARRRRLVALAPAEPWIAFPAAQQPATGFCSPSST
jgi:hypothetical protein